MAINPYILELNALTLKNYQTVDFTNKQITFKRSFKSHDDSSKKMKESEHSCDDLVKKMKGENENNSIKSDTCITDKLGQILPDVMTQLNAMGRSEDFGSILEAIGTGKLCDNIALHLLLDVGRFFRQETAYSMHYRKTTLDFWTLVSKVVHRKGMRLLEGDSGKCCYIMK